MLPIVDLNKPRKEILRMLKLATTEFGAFYVKSNFSCKQSTELFSAAATLHQTRAELKSKLFFHDGGFSRGFLKSGSESGSTNRESKQGFAYGFDLKGQSKNNLEGANIWPEFKGNERQVLNSFFNECTSISNVLTLHLAEIFTGNESSWEELFFGGERISLMRLFSYPAVNEIPLGSSPHTDWGHLTLIKAQETVPGLEVFSNGKWIKVPALPPGESDPSNFWIANAGDYMSLLTNGQTISPLHRVLLSASARSAFVYFCYPHYNVPIPKYRGAKLSIFENQGTSYQGAKASCFGELLFQKWLQVYRTSY